MAEVKKHLTFEEHSDTGKTKTWRVWNGGDGSSKGLLGTVKWYSPWRRYVFYPAPIESLFDAGCLDEIVVFLRAQMGLRPRSKRRKSGG